MATMYYRPYTTEVSFICSYTMYYLVETKLFKNFVGSYIYIYIYLFYLKNTIRSLDKGLFICILFLSYIQ